MEWFLDTLRDTPELAIFLTLALGFALGKLRIGKFSLGSVTGVLLTGVLIGQADLSIPSVVKSTFFLLFLFAVGYSVGPQFVKGLKKDGLPQMAFAAIVCALCLLVPFLAAKIAGFDTGNAVGLLSGGNTISAVIGVATDTIRHLPMDAAEKARQINEIPVAYAVTYIFGTAGTAWFLASIGPKLISRDIVQETREYEASLGGSIVDDDPALEKAYDGTTFRTIQATCPRFDHPHTVAAVEKMLVQRDWPVYIERLRNGKGQIVSEPAPDQLIHKNDILVLNGPIESMLGDQDFIGREVADTELLDFRVESLSVIVCNKQLEGKTLGVLKTSPERHGVILRKVRRGNAELPLTRNLQLHRGDVLEIEGRKTDVERFATYAGYAERPTKATDLLFVGAGIFLGGLLGSLVVRAGNVPLSLSASGGVLVMGIIFGWLRSLRPVFGAIPEPAVWLMNNLGLNLFIAVVGLSAGPDFIAGLKAHGVSLFVAGVFVSLIPMLIGLLVGKYLFKFPAPINLGACAGSRTTTAALGAIQDALQSKTPALSYTTTYAVGCILLITWGVVIVLLMQ
jgi:putative transport protein